MSVTVTASSAASPSGFVSHTVRIVDTDAGVNVSEQCSATGPGKMPTIQRCAELAYAKLLRIVDETRRTMLSHNLITEKMLSEGPYR